VAKLCKNKKFNKSPKIILSPDYKNFMELYKLDEVLKFIWNKVTTADKHIDCNQPWKITDEKKLTSVLQEAIDQILEIAYLLQPFLPQTADKIQSQFLNSPIDSLSPLFPRII
jgi:methionyl-tRNA synthetase